MSNLDSFADSGEQPSLGEDVRDDLLDPAPVHVDVDGHLEGAYK